MRLMWVALLLALLPAFAAAQPVPVTTAPLAALLIRPEASAPATVEPLNQSRLAAELSARIEAIPVRIGEPVAAGDLLVRLDCRATESALAAARAAEAENLARRRFAGQQLARALDLKRARNISEELVQQRESELGVLEAQARALAEAARQAGIRTDHCTLVAPYAGWVVERLAGIGELASVGAPLIELVQRDALEVSAPLREDDAATIEEAAGLWFAHRGERYPLQLRRLLPVVNTRARTREARLAFVDAQAPPGAPGRLVWRPPGAMVQADYLVRRGDRLGLFIADGAVARFHPLPAAVEGQPAAVGLPEQTLIVVEGRQRLRDGDPLRPE